MKKRFLIIIISVIFTLRFLIPYRIYAAQFPFEQEYFPENYNPVSCADFEVIANSQKYSSLNLRSSDFHYIILYQRSGNSDILSRFYAWSSDFEYTLDESDGVYTFTFSCPESNPYSYDLGCICREGTSNFDFNFGVGYAVSKLVYNSNSFTFEFLFANGSRDVYFTDAFAYRTDLADEQGALQFSFTPNLEGDMSRIYESDGLTLTVDTFACTVDNMSTNGYQYCWAIIPHDSEFTPYKASNLPGGNIENQLAIDTKMFFSGSPTFIYFKDEWVYIPAAGASEQSVLTPSSWHYIPPKGHIDDIVQFNQVKLDASQQYDVVCYGLPAVGSQASYIPSGVFSANTEHSVDFSQCEIYLKQTFSIKNPASFNRDTTGFGAYSFDPDDREFNISQLRKTFAYKDENGNPVIQNNDMSDFNLSIRPVNGYNYSSVKQTDTESIGSTVDSYFSICARVLGYFPNSALIVLKLGLAAMVTLAIYKKVII